MPEPGSEFERIAALVSSLPRGEGVIVGPGDDAAVLRVRDGRDLVATTDTFVEGRHFRRDVLTPAETGARLAAANLSDLAAMAAEPRWALLSLVLPPSWTHAECMMLERACARALAADGAAIVGGNLAAGEGPFTATLTLLGEVERGMQWTRGGAKPGDLVAVTGAPGSAAAFLALALTATVPKSSVLVESSACALKWRGSPRSEHPAARSAAASAQMHLSSCIAGLGRYQARTGPGNTRCVKNAVFSAAREVIPAGLVEHGLRSPPGHEHARIPLGRFADVREWHRALARETLVLRPLRGFEHQ